MREEGSPVGEPLEYQQQWEQEFREMEEGERKEKERLRLLESAAADLKMVLPGALPPPDPHTGGRLLLWGIISPEKMVS